MILVVVLDDRLLCPGLGLLPRQAEIRVGDVDGVGAGVLAGCGEFEILFLTGIFLRVALTGKPFTIAANDIGILLRLICRNLCSRCHRLYER